MKIALITDTHFGARNDSLQFAEYFRKFYQQQFFPYLKDNGITTVIHLGDIVDRRKFINYVSAKHLRDDFIQPCKDMGIDLHVIIGNHDTFYKNTNDVNSMDILHGDINYYAEPTDVEIDGTLITMMPWINNSNYEECLKHIETTPADLLFGHLELRGFEMYRGAVNEDGMSGEIFSKFDKVLTGHFHHRSTQGNLSYLGCPYEITWADYNDPKGFHVFDTSSRELKFIENRFKMFYKIHYDDSAGEQEKAINISDKKLLEMSGCYVKIIVSTKNNPYWFDMLIDKLEKCGVADIQVVEDHLNLNIENEDDIINEAEDTISIIRKYIKSLDYKNDKELENLFFSLYNDVLASDNSVR